MLFTTQPSDRNLPTEAVAIIAELRGRQELIRRMLDDSFPAQRSCIVDPALMQAVLTTRRAGKSMGIALKHAIKAIKMPGCNQLYTGLTRDACKRILKEECLEPMCERYKLRSKWNGQAWSFTFLDYDTILYMLGVDSSDKEREKALGGKYSLVSIDEAGSYETDQETLVYKILKPAVADHRGTISLYGTPQDNIYSLFYEITNGLRTGWSVHKWSALDNPYMREQWIEQIEELLRDNPLFDQTPTYKQMYLGQWVIDDSKLVYRFNEDRDLIDELPELSGDRVWHNVLGVDLGFEDDSAFTVTGYKDYDPLCYVPESYKRKGMDLTDVATLIKSYFIPRYHPEKFIVDGADKQAVEEMRNRHGIPFVAAEKSAKADFIHILNDDFIQKKIKLVRGKTAMLQQEMKTLVWDERKLQKGQRVEDAKCPNHCCDAFLYPWRYCYNYVDHGMPPREPKTDEDRVDAFWEQEAEAGIANQHKEFWER